MSNTTTTIEQAPLSNRRRTLIFINIMLSCIATTIMATALTTALPPIAKDLGVTMQTGQWLTSGYSLAMGIVMPLTAFLITRFPTKPLYLIGAALFIAGSLVMMPLYVQTIKGDSASMAGLVGLPGSLAMAVISPMAGKLYDRFGVKRLFLVGGICLTASNLCMGLLPLDASIWVAAAINVMRSLAIGCLMMPLVTWGTASAGEGRLADANALLTALRTIAGAIGQAVFVGMMTALAASAQSGGMDAAAANMHGLNLTFLAMGACAVPLIIIPLVFLRRKNGSERSAR